MEGSAQTPNQNLGGRLGFNVWPDVDRELVTDYGRKPNDPLYKFFRIHIDIPIPAEKWDSLRTALDAGNAAQVYEIISGIVGPATQVTKTGHAVVEAALKP